MSAITDRGSPEPKEYNFRSSPAALEALDAAGVDVVSVANNHAVDYGAVGLRDTLAAVRDSPLAVVGIGHHAARSYGPRLGRGPGPPGVAVAFLPRPRLVDAVREAKQVADVVVVYLHWGEEQESCPYWPLRHARVLAAVGADVVVGSHAHVLLGRAGWGTRTSATAWATSSGTTTRRS